MTTEALKSTSITNSDATPRVANQAGKGAHSATKEVDDFVTTTSGVTTGSTYRIVRIPSNAIVKSVVVETEAMGGSSAVDIGLYYADAPDSAPANQSAGVGAVISAAFFASAQSLVSALTPTNVTNESGTYTLNKRSQPIWQAAGLATDPGGKFDIVLTSTATITTGARVGLNVRLAVEG